MPIEAVPGTSLTYYLVAFDALGNERDEDGVPISRKILEALSGEPITDVFLISHGWQGDVPAARRQYGRWLGAMASNQADLAHMHEVWPGFRPLLIGLHWPSLPWGDEELGGDAVSFDPTAVSPVEQLIDAYAARIAGTPAARTALQTIFHAALRDIAPARLSLAVGEAYEVLNREASLRSEGEGAAPGADREPFDPQRLFQAAEAEPVSFGGGVGLGGILAPLRALSFWKMKDRARQFGESAGFRLLQSLQRAASDTVRFHLIGHSFGCIVASATLAGPESCGALVRPVNSVALLQGALSLWSYCPDIPVADHRAGYFHSLVADGKVAGPIITTQSQLDTAVGKLYPLAAGVAQQVNFAPGELPKYGALGTFGARGDRLDVVDMTMLPSEASYSFAPGKIYNLEGSRFICDVRGGGLSGAHNDIAKPEVAHAVWSAACAE